MLVLTRKPGERVVIAENMVIEVLEVHGNRVRIGIQAPQDVTIVREELLAGKAKDEKKEARSDTSSSSAEGLRAVEAVPGETERNGIAAQRVVCHRNV